MGGGADTIISLVLGPLNVLFGLQMVHWRRKPGVFSRVQLFVTPWTVSHQAPLSIEFSRQEY